MPRLGLPLLPSPFRWGLVAAIALVIFANSILFVTPAPPGAEPGPFWDKKLHFAAYAVFAASIAYATARSAYEQRTRWLVVVGLAMIYGISIELLQAQLPDRYFSYADLLANAIGAILGLGYLLIEKRVPYLPLDELL